MVSSASSWANVRSESENGRGILERNVLLERCGWRLAIWGSVEDRKK
jgi:hypothetical protein